MKRISIIGAGLAGSEAALQLADRGFSVRLVEMRPEKGTPVHKTGLCAELVCSNSLKSTKPESAAGMLKAELAALGSQVHAAALDNAVAAGGALAVDREAFARQITQRIQEHPGISLEHAEVRSVQQACEGADTVILASGPLTSDALAESLSQITGSDHMAFYDAAAPIVMADSLDMGKLFRQSRYEDAGGQVGDYLNAPFSREEYEAFIEQLIGADRVIRREFETRDLFQACQPIEEIARKGVDAPRFGTLKPVGLTDPATGRRPWAALQLRAEDAHGESYNLVGFQTNLTFPEQKRVFRMIPGLEQAEFARYGVMHRNTFINAPKLLTPELSRLQHRWRRCARVRGGSAGGHRGLLRGDPFRASCGVACRRAARRCGGSAAAGGNGVWRIAGIRHRSRHRRLSAHARELRHHGAA